MLGPSNCEKVLGIWTWKITAFQELQVWGKVGLERTLGWYLKDNSCHCEVRSNGVGCRWKKKWRCPDWRKNERPASISTLGKWSFNSRSQCWQVKEPEAQWMTGPSPHALEPRSCLRSPSQDDPFGNREPLEESANSKRLSLQKGTQSPCQEICRLLWALGQDLLVVRLNLKSCLMVWSSWVL